MILAATVTRTADRSAFGLDESDLERVVREPDKWQHTLKRFAASRQIKGARELFALAGERSRKTRCLATVDWAPLLGRPIDEVRETLGMGAPPTYTRHMRNPNGRGLVPEPLAS